MTRSAHFVDDQLLRVGDREFVCTFPDVEVGPGQLNVLKPRGLAQRYVDLVEQVSPKVIVELGIFSGGSTALLQALTEPRKLVAFEIDEDPASLLTDYIDRHDLGDVVRPYYGVDQSDRARLRSILADELGGELIDVVFDDASHMLDESRSSFETLFPLVRPGGLFVIEDWTGSHLLINAVHRALSDPSTQQYRDVVAQIRQAEAEGRVDTSFVPLTAMIVELLLTQVVPNDVIAEVCIDPEWTVVRRGTGDIDPENFKLTDLYEDHIGFLRSLTSRVDSSQLAAG